MQRRAVWQKSFGAWVSSLSKRGTTWIGRHFARRHWVFILLQLVALGVAIYWLRWLPPTGYAVAAVAGLAAAMTVQTEMQPGHKAAWMLLVGGFLFIEFRAINKDRADFALQELLRRKEENAKFQAIADRLELTVSGISDANKELRDILKLPEKSLKRRTVQLAQAMKEFLDTQEAEEAKLVALPARPGEQVYELADRRSKEVQGHKIRSLDQFKSRYGQSCLALTQELLVQEKSNDITYLNPLCSNPQDSSSIRVVSRVLLEAARKAKY
jgi:hypothetical protein